MSKRIFVTLFLLLNYILLISSDGYPRNDKVDVTHYNFTIHLSDSTDEIIGISLISLSVSSPVDTLFFDLSSLDSDNRGMMVTGVKLNGSVSGWIHKNDRLSVYALNGTGAEGKCQVEINYRGVPRDGLIISKNKFGDRTFFADNWPNRAHNWIPCVDHPSDKATVEFTVYAPGEYSVVSNGYLFEESSLKGGKKLTHWKEDVSIPTKVMVIGVARFARQLAGKSGNTEIWSWVYPDDREAGFSDYRAAIKPFIFYSNLLGTYSYEKLANVESKTIFGGMENAGCIFYSERSVSGKNRTESLMAHEIAHQWFGDSVTEGDWYHIWLSEGFATYLTALYLESEYGQEAINAEMSKARNRVIYSYGRNPSPVIDTTVTDYMRLLNANSYQKGAWVLHMLRQKVGDEAFRIGLRTYYSRFRNSTALTSDFENTMEEVTHTNLKQFFYQWLIKPEIPVLEIRQQALGKNKGTRITVVQRQDGVAFDIDLDLRITSESGSETRTISINQKEYSFVIKSDRVTDITPDPDTRLLFIPYTVTAPDKF